MAVEGARSESNPAGWKLWFDGASNLLGNGIRVVLASPKDQCFPFLAKLGYDYTNNMAKYEACAMGITMAIEHQVKMLRVFGDSAEWKTHDAKLIPYHNYVMEMSEQFEKITFHYVPQDENQMADALATLSAMLLVNKEQELTIQVQHQVRIAHCQQLDQDDTEAKGKP
ncbi:hypothetical protein CR513_44290, partial [Mucuna pruriens]